jgi:L-ascorbate metabolism protein UlaG (beta-lactamase superfamily)
MKQLVTVLVLSTVAASAAPPEEFATAAGPLKLTPIQHASLMIQAGGKVLYIDPAQGSYEGLPPADYILITDIHGDHMAPAVVDKIKKAGTVILAPKAVAEKIPGCTVISNGETKTIGDFKVEAIPMYNLKPAANGTVYHDKGRGNGYVVTYGGKRFYFSGDTEGTPEMKALRNIDVAFVCMNLPYTMPPDAAAEAVRAFHPAIVYPYHYNGSDLKVFEKGLAGSGIEVRIRDWYPK